MAKHHVAVGLRRETLKPDRRLLWILTNTRSLET